MKRRIEKRKDPKYMGVPNINFSLISQNEEREGEFMNQRKTRGFDDSELWSLDCTICAFIAPRLKAFIDTNRHGIPIDFIDNEDGWRDILLKMLYSFENYSVFYGIEEKDIENKVKEGLELFHKYFSNLWD